MARNYINMVDDEDEEVELFERLAHSNKRKYNKANDTQEKIKRQRRESVRRKEVQTDNEY